MAAPESRRRRGVTQVNLEIEPELLGRLKEVAKANDRSVSAQVRRWIREGLERERAR